MAGWAGDRVEGGRGGAGAWMTGRRMDGKVTGAWGVDNRTEGGRAESGKWLTTG